MRQFTKMALVAATLFLVIALPARAADAVTANDTALFLAGMMPSADSPLMPLTRDPSWQRHAKFFDAAFAQLEQRQLSKIRAWAAANLAAPKPVVFYMFSGPDFLYADAFYSKATTYVLSALEPPGSVPDLTKLPRGEVGAALYDVERSMGSILSFSFFITKQMKVDLRAGELSGTLPILYVFLARSGKTIREVSPVALDDKGAAYGAGENPGKNATHGRCRDACSQRNFADGGWRPTHTRRVRPAAPPPASFTSQVHACLLSVGQRAGGRLACQVIVCLG